jgi:hypothetical protein
MGKKVYEGFLWGVGAITAYMFVLPVLQAIKDLIFVCYSMQMP